ncbi:hypothetical protein KP17_00900 [Pectobacterium parvum]|nr:hypothetical protein KP17_00900 [Pectobacterium parvum]KHS99261.1 hypothetical protein RC88_02685 [Pectobacterium parvum]
MGHGLSINILVLVSTRTVKKIDLMTNCKIDYCGALPIKQIIAALLADFYAKNGLNRIIPRE